MREKSWQISKLRLISLFTHQNHTINFTRQLSIHNEQCDGGGWHKKSFWAFNLFLWIFMAKQKKILEGVIGCPFQCFEIYYFWFFFLMYFSSNFLMEISSQFLGFWNLLAFFGFCFYILESFNFLKLF